MVRYKFSDVNLFSGHGWNGWIGRPLNLIDPDEYCGIFSTYSARDAFFFFLFLVESFYSNQRVCRHKKIWSNLIVLRLQHLPTTQQWSSEEVEQDKPRLVQLHFLDIFHLYNRIFWNKDTSEMLCFDKTISTCCVTVVDLSLLFAVISTVVVVLYWSPGEREKIENIFDTLHMEWSILVFCRCIPGLFLLSKD